MNLLKNTSVNSPLVVIGAISIFLVSIPISIFLKIKNILANCFCNKERSVQGQVVLLTGAGGGLGRCMALDFAARGCRIACIDFNEKTNQETTDLVRKVTKQDSSAKAYTVNLQNIKEIEAVVANVIKDFGCVDILISNAANLAGGPISELTDDYIDNMVQVNFLATVRLVKLLLPHMKERRTGQLVAISSIASFKGAHNMSMYCATKSALTGFMETLYDELRQDPSNKISVSVVHPYFMKTVKGMEYAVDANLKLMEADSSSNEIVKRIVAQEFFITVPRVFTLLMALRWLVPQVVQDFCNDHLMCVKCHSAASYELRHIKDAEGVREFLANNDPLPNNPAERIYNFFFLYPTPNNQIDLTPYIDKVKKYYEITHKMAAPKRVIEIMESTRPNH